MRVASRTKRAEGEDVAGGAGWAGRETAAELPRSQSTPLIWLETPAPVVLPAVHVHASVVTGARLSGGLPWPTATG